MSMQWYIIHTYSGFEKKVKESLESRVAAFTLQDKIGRVAIAAELLYLRVCNTNSETRVSVSGAPDSFFNEKSITK